MATRRPMRRARGSSPNRDWAFADVGGTSVTAGNKVLLGSFTPDSFLDQTVLRTRGAILAYAASLGGDYQIAGAFGMMVTTDEAVAAGVASLPGPLTDAGNDVWFVWEPILGFLDVTGTLEQSEQFFRQIIDSKAKRIIENGRRIALVAECRAGTSGFTLQAMIRVLAMTRGTG